MDFIGLDFIAKPTALKDDFDSLDGSLSGTKSMYGTQLSLFLIYIMADFVSLLTLPSFRCFLALLN